MTYPIINSKRLEHPYVQRVVQIAEEIVNQNKPLTTEVLYNTAKRRLNLSHRGLLSIIQFLFHKKILVERSKYTKESILLNRYRKKIYNYICNRLGVHFSLIRKEILTGDDKLGSAGQLIWHLQMLIRFNYIKKVKVGNFTIFLPIDIDDEKGRLYFILRDELNKKIINLFIEGRQIKKADAYKFLDESREQIYYHLNNLIEYGILTSSEQEHEQLLLSSDQKELIKEILLKKYNNNRESRNI